MDQPAVAEHHHHQPPPPQNNQPELAAAGAGAEEHHVARCQCCGLTEECTRAYMERVRERHGGRWICGLCAEAVKDRSKRDGIGGEEALRRHMGFCQQFKRDRSSTVLSEDRLITAWKILFKRGLDSPRRKKSGSVFPSCMEEEEGSSGQGQR